MQQKWTHTKKKMLNVTTAVAYSVFFEGKLYTTEQMFVLVSMGILRLR